MSFITSPGHMIRGRLRITAQRATAARCWTLGFILSMATVSAVISDQAR